VIADLRASLALPREMWNVIRLGWRSRSMESYKGDGCAPGCSCSKLTELDAASKVCLLANAPSASDPAARELEAAAVRAAALPIDAALGEGGGGANCDIRGSESYILHKGSFELVHRRLTRWTPGPVGTPWSRYQEPAGGAAVGLCTLNQVDPCPITCSLSNP
jgi:hypothetical protein